MDLQENAFYVEILVGPFFHPLSENIEVIVVKIDKILKIKIIIKRGRNYDKGN